MPSGASVARPLLSLVAAIDQNRLLAVNHRIPWHLPRDVSHYRAYTADQWLLVGRRTYDQMHGWFRPGHVPLVLTHRLDWKPERGRAVSSVEEALRFTAEAGREELMCCGGEHVYEAAMPFAGRLVMTLIEHRFPAEGHAIYFPEWNPEEWVIESSTRYEADAENPYAMTIQTLRRRSRAS